jgi:hypothetical protein
VILEFVRTGGLIRGPLPTIELKLSIVRRLALPTDWRAPHTSEVEQFASRGPHNVRDSRRYEPGLAISVGLAKTDFQLKGGAEVATAEVRVSRRALRLGRRILRA